MATDNPIGELKYYSFNAAKKIINNFNGRSDIQKDDFLFDKKSNEIKRVDFIQKEGNGNKFHLMVYSKSNDRLEFNEFCVLNNIDPEEFNI